MNIQFFSHQIVGPPLITISMASLLTKRDFIGLTFDFEAALDQQAEIQRKQLLQVLYCVVDCSKQQTIEFTLIDNRCAATNRGESATMQIFCQGRLCQRRHLSVSSCSRRQGKDRGMQTLAARVMQKGSRMRVSSRV